MHSYPLTLSGQWTVPTAHYLLPTVLQLQRVFDHWGVITSRQVNGKNLW